MKIAVEGCAHGELEKIYETLQHLEKQEGIKVDLLICCGDFQATRNMQDLSCMAVSQKYRDMCTFYKYYSGEKTAPVLTVFIGGNHEASNHLQELGYGGWAAPNIYYLGYAGVVTIGGIRIAGLSGIYKGRDYMRGRYERVPYSEDTKRSVYHIRNLDVFRLKQLSKPVDIMLSHDWPRGVTEFGDTKKLLQKKPFFKKDIEENVLGSQPAEELLHDIQPTYWFSAHLHCKFPALVPHGPRKGVTKFLALDKCLPRRKFLQIVDIEHDSEKSLELCYDLEWLAILHSTNHLLSVKKGLTYMPGRSDHERWIFTPTEEEKEFILKRFKNDLKIPENFTQSVTAYSPNSPGSCTKPSIQLNPQTVAFCERLGVDDPLALLQDSSSLDETMSPFSLPRTPDRSYDTSQVSFTADENESLNSSGEDVNRLSSRAGSTGKRFSMSLPPPKLSFGEDEDFIPLSDSQDQEPSPGSKSSHSQEQEPSPSSKLSHSQEQEPSPSSKLSHSQEQEPSPSSKLSHSQEQEPSPSSNLSHSQKQEPSLSSKSSQLSEESPIVSDFPLSESITPTSQNDDCRPQKKFKRRNQSLYSATEDD